MNEALVFVYLAYIRKVTNLAELRNPNLWSILNDKVNFMSKKTLFRITFANQEAIYEIYARAIKDSEIFGFLEVEELVFGEQTALVVDPSEEKLKMEFNGVKRTYIPIHSIIRIDEVTKQGTAKVKDNLGYGNKVSPFPGTGKTRE